MTSCYQKLVDHKFDLDFRTAAPDLDPTAHLTSPAAGNSAMTLAHRGHVTWRCLRTADRERYLPPPTTRWPWRSPHPASLLPIPLLTHENVMGKYHGPNHAGTPDNSSSCLCSLYWLHQDEITAQGKDNQYV